MRACKMAGCSNPSLLTAKLHSSPLGCTHVRRSGRPSRKVLLYIRAQYDQRHGPADSESTFLPLQLQHQASSTVASLRQQWEQTTATALYKYFIWRKDAFSDLQAITLLVVGLVLTSVVCKVVFLGQSGVAAWHEFYAAAVTTFGEAWPPTTAPIPQQVRQDLSTCNLRSLLPAAGTLVLQQQ
eukprot:GHUV01034263.1.p1 GENE.GHUV01034263.1~~GHUV01034263.1.p1  ORF type:complete len:183 (+),score=38.62 GHUV01034263.1:267-815(+)